MDLIDRYFVARLLGIPPRHPSGPVIYHPRRSGRTVKKRWRFSTPDGGEYEVAISGPTLAARWLRRQPVRYFVAYSSQWSQVLPSGNGGHCWGLDGFLGDFDTYAAAQSAAEEFIRQNRYAV
jgi:hypothetical protein